jgi:hypothetical protein
MVGLTGYQEAIQKSLGSAGLLQCGNQQALVKIRSNNMMLHLMRRRSPVDIVPAVMYAGDHHGLLQLIFMLNVNDIAHRYRIGGSDLIDLENAFDPGLVELAICALDNIPGAGRLIYGGGHLEECDECDKCGNVMAMSICKITTFPTFILHIPTFITFLTFFRKFLRKFSEHRVTQPNFQ